MKYLYLLLCLVTMVSLAVISFNAQLVQTTPEIFSAPVQASVGPEPAPLAVQEPMAIPESIQVTSGISVEITGDDSTVLYERDAQKPLPMASLAKLMTALVVLENYHPDNTVTISQESIEQIGEQGVIKLGEVLSAKDLLYIMLIESSNRAAYALAEFMGVKNFIYVMNQGAKGLGLANTYFADATGLSTDSYSTAADIAQLSQYLFTNYPLFGEIVGLKEHNLYGEDGKLHHTLVNTNKLLGQDGIIGGKTGWTKEAKGCMMVIQQNSPNTYIIHVVLGAEDRFLEISKLIAQTK